MKSDRILPHNFKNSDRKSAE